MKFAAASAISFAIAGIFAGQTIAASLPKGASELPSDEVKAMYAGKSADWKSVRVYFDPEGTAKLVRKDKKAYGEGQWTVSGNQMCMTINPIDVAKGKRKAIKDCYSWYQSGGRYFMRWSGDDGKDDAYRDDEPSRLSEGDNVSKDFAALEGS
ncbi:hypothetical protein ABID21_001124 [Pseudorhizobium tarimense]|uniref:Beta/Gamma crystallin n=1 Tax=Pseudorhizobium tarimense TaxID=1079109 RepID=A0ABV2H3B9_9HYPH|nr:DUF995 domain-containing protein [Pseudorhizobium tarimense]MCJ8517998.1 DUF995 domain-containing protein [Pseudorhizobium tarimense]